MASLKTILARTFFYEPQVGLPTTPGQVALVAGTERDQRQTYRVDARVLAPPEQTPALQNELHNALKKALPDLRNGRFSIAKIEAVRDEQGTVIAYQVEIHR
jgi:hypothetical protein